MNFGRDPDDWFEGIDPEERPVSGRGRDRDREDWLQDAAAPPRAWLESIDKRVVVLAVVGIALLIAVLAAAGVFSSNPPASVTTVTSTTTNTTTTTQQTTTPPAQALPAPTTTLKPGDTGAQVTVLQRALASLGFSSGKIDGQYGPSTESAVKGFQRTAKLTPDGIVGPATLAALATALRGG
jgi:hypothetical protein